MVHKNQPVTPDFILTEIERFRDNTESNKTCAYLHRNNIELRAIKIFKRILFFRSSGRGKEVNG